MTKEFINKTNYFILTGGPGSGKTTTLNELTYRGFLTVPEAARTIIRKQTAINGNATHTADRAAFRDLMLEHSIDDYKKVKTERYAVFFDRGIPDLYGYSKAFCSEVSNNITQSIAQFRYNQLVFIFPPWQEIYEQDKERKQDFQEAILTYAALKEAYLDCGYHVVEVPMLSMKLRADFILKTITETCLTNLKNDINQLLGFHEDIPRINYGPCGVFAKLFFDAWNNRFKDKVHIVFVKMRSQE